MMKGYRKLISRKDIGMSENATSVMPPHETIAAEEHSLFDSWTLFAHLPHDTDWSLKSYKSIHTYNTAEGTLAVAETLPDALVRNCMLFMMRKGIQPTWEDTRNRHGGCFSYKVTNKLVPSTWRNLMLSVAGETAANRADIAGDITGITISPKKNFCIIKVWMGSCRFQNPDHITGVNGPAAQGCIFKKQTPEY
jgi:hypothetical protein